MIALAVAGAAAPDAVRRWIGAALVAAFLACGVVGVAVLHDRLHRLGHERGKPYGAPIGSYARSARGLSITLG